MLAPERIDQLIAVYRDGLLNDTLPFWINHAIDRQCGGYLNALDHDGSILSTDKAIWIQGRFIWLLSRLYNEVEKKQEWLDLARHGLDFLLRHGFDTDGRMFFRVTRDGKPLMKRRYIYSETFAVIALAEHARATGDDALRHKAGQVFRLLNHYLVTPGLLPPKVIPQTRRWKGLAVPMILIATVQVLRQVDPSDFYRQVVDDSISQIEHHFMHPEFPAVLENVGPEGQFLDTFEGRTVNPGHAIEAGWFILEEARQRGNDRHLIQLACKIIDYSLEIGWDKEFGGIYYFRDVKGLPCEQYEHDMKLWWPHNETIYACLLAYHLTGEQRYLNWHRKVHDWAYAHFPDRAHGEWYGYLHRDGSVSVRLKGNMWKGPFHLPRMQLYCWKLLEEMKGKLR